MPYASGRPAARRFAARRIDIAAQESYHDASRVPVAGGVSRAHGQVAQLVEHGPEKAGVGGSSPPLSTVSKPLSMKPL